MAWLMPIGEAEAIAAARTYADRQGCPAWCGEPVRALPVVFQDRECWLVMADDAPRQGNTWMDREIDGGQSYLIDPTGNCIGIGLLNGYRILPR